MKESDNYLKIVEWSEEDQAYIGTCPALAYGGVHGDDEQEVYRELCQIVEEWIQIYKEDGDPLPEGIAGKNFSGEFRLRISPQLHKLLSIQALKSKQSLNAYCAQALESQLNP